MKTLRMKSVIITESRNLSLLQAHITDGIYLIKAHNIKTKATRKNCWKLTIKTQNSVIYFEQTSHVGFSIVGFEQVNAGWEACQTNEINQIYWIYESFPSTGPCNTFPIKGAQQASTYLKLLVTVLDQRDNFAKS